MADLYGWWHKTSQDEEGGFGLLGCLGWFGKIEQQQKHGAVMLQWVGPWCGRVSCDLSS